MAKITESTFEQQTAVQPITINEIKKKRHPPPPKPQIESKVRIITKMFQDEIYEQVY